MHTYRVSRVGDNGANHTGKVPRSKGDTQLGALGVALLGGSKDVGVEGFHDLLEEEELGHGVRDLAGPQGHQGAEGEPVHWFSFVFIMRVYVYETETIP